MFNTDQRRAFIAVVLSGIVLFGWQYYFAPQTNENTLKSTVKEEAAKAQTQAPASATTTTPQAPAALGAAQPAPEAVALSSNVLKNKEFEFKMNNDLSITEMKNPNSVFSFSSLTDSSTPLRVQLLNDNGAPTELLFTMEQQGENKLVGRNDAAGVTLTATLLENGKVDINIASTKPHKFRFIFDAKPKKLDNGQVRHFAVYGNDVKFITVDDDQDADANIKWMGVDFNYHLFALVFKDKLAAKYKTTEAGQMSVELPSATQNISFDLVFTKKNYDTLIGLGDNLHLSVDFGFFAVLAVPILRGLQWFYRYIPNYGVAIILLTILIRLVTFPLQYKSFKSMKKMQLIQPELQKIKDKYKDEPQKMQKETMELFKKAGANPLSGCLPLLLQMPFFFAIYRVLYSAVELVGAPFYWWIKDLSIHDPFYVLPVLMGLSMFAQQKLTPQTSVDPTQQKIMLLMPIIFAFIMKSLPAGLVLYIFVSTVVGILQQVIVYKMAD